MGIHSREIHEYILRQIEQALGRRTWSWLARESGVPQSTLATQVGKPKFSFELLRKIAPVLDKNLAYFLPEPSRDSESPGEADHGPGRTG